MIEKDRRVDTLEQKSGGLDFFLLEQQYQTFLSWWEENSHQFSTLSFNIENQSRQFFGDLDCGVDFETAFLKIRSDLWGYYLEYIKQEAILPFTNRIKNGRLVGDFYGDKPIVDLVDNKEREGALSEAMIDLEERLKTLQPGQFVFRASPEGWTNMGYDYTETQFQIFWQEDNNLVRGLTVRTGADLEAVIEILKQLGNQFSGTTERELLKEITRANLVLTEKSLTEIIELISQYTDGLDHRGRLLVDQYQRWQNNDGRFQRYDQLVSLLNYLEEKVKSMMTNNEFLREKLESLLGYVLMTMAVKEQEEGKVVDLQKVSDYYYPDSRYLAINPLQLNRSFIYLQSLPGCAGGGRLTSRNGIFQGPLGSFTMTPFNVAEINNQESSGQLLKCVNCPFCHKVVDAEIVVKSGKKKIHCPNCNAEVDYESN